MCSDCGMFNCMFNYWTSVRHSLHFLSSFSTLLLVSSSCWQLCWLIHIFPASLVKSEIFLWSQANYCSSFCVQTWYRRKCVNSVINPPPAVLNVRWYLSVDFSLISEVVLFSSFCKMNLLSSHPCESSIKNLFSKFCISGLQVLLLQCDVLGWRRWSKQTTSPSWRPSSTAATLRPPASWTERSWRCSATNCSWMLTCRCCSTPCWENEPMPG